jgi:glycine/D-amino acid oxidase-like deaminating enzyme
MGRIETDICVVGAGIVGLAHALEAAARGMRVVVLERDERATNASVRNFGHVFLAAMGEGDALDAALAARERWLELGARARLQVIEAGSLVLARHDDELAVLQGLAAEPRRGARMITPRMAAALAPIPTDGVLGALHAQLDLRVDPQAVARAQPAPLPGASPISPAPSACVPGSRPNALSSWTRAST